MGNRHSIVRTTNRIEPVQNNKKIVNIKNNNIKIHHEIRLRDNEGFFEQRIGEITVKKNNLQDDARTPVHPQI